MFVLIILLTSIFYIQCLVRSSVDYDTPNGNCTVKEPVYASQIGRNRFVRCYNKLDLIETRLSYDKIRFLDINSRRFIRINHVSDIRGWTMNDGWVRISWKRFNIRHHHLEYTPSLYGELIYIRDRGNVHIFIRSFGEESVPTATPRQGSTTKLSTTSSPVSTTKLSTTHVQPTRNSKGNIGVNNYIYLGFLAIIPLMITLVVVKYYRRKPAVVKHIAERQQRSLMFYNNAYDDC